MKLRVLVFDDDPAVRAVLQMLLERQGCEVMTYQDPSLCPLISNRVCQCGSNRGCADLIIADVSTPRLSGLDLAERLRRSGCKVPQVVLMAGTWSGEVVNKAQALDCQVVEKPFRVGTLYEWVEECMQRVDPARCLVDPTMLGRAENDSNRRTRR